MFEELVKKNSKWLAGLGPNSDIVISSRVRLARNISGYCFPQIIKDEDFAKLLLEIKKAAGKTKIFKGAEVINLNQASELDRYVLMERHIISYDQVIAERKKAVVFSKDEEASLMINEEDHLRMQVIMPGMRLKDCWKKIDKIDSELEKELAYAFSKDIGFLTACPTNTGTGLRASAMVHLPGLVLNKDIGKIFHRISELGLVVRGFYGEGVDIKTSFYQISNQISLGQAENELISDIERITKQVVENEQKAREGLFKNDKIKLEDSIWRAYGILKNTRTISFEEAISLLSSLRLGIESKIINLNIKCVNELLIVTQPGHIQKLSGKAMQEIERDLKRAELIRKKLKEGECGDVS